MGTADVRYTIQIKCDPDPTGWKTIVDCEPDKRIAMASWQTVTQSGHTARMFRSTIELIAWSPNR